MKLVFVLSFVAAAVAAETGRGYSGSFASGNGYGYGGSFGSGGGTFSNTGGQGGGAGSGAGGGAGGSGIPPAFPGYVPYDFNNFLTYSFSVTNAKANSKVAAQSSLTFGDKGMLAQQNFVTAGFPGAYPGAAPNYAGGFGYGGSFPNFAGGSSGNAPNYGGAAASAAIGPGGAHQSASVFPENPDIPNINTRLGAAPGGGSYGGVFTSSQSVSSNVDGKEVSHHQASTTINDNGKVTTYTVHNP